MIAQESNNKGFLLRRQNINQALLWVVLAAFAVAFLFPLIWLLVTSLKTQTEYGTWPVVLLPKVWQWKNYVNAVTLIRNPSFLQATLHSVLLILLGGVPTVLTSAMVGFGFARHKAPGRNLLFGILLATIMIPGLVTTIPTFVVYAKLKLINTYWPWFIGGLGSSAYYVFLFRQFFANFPADLENAAEIDGCNRWQIFWKIFIPNAGPVLAVCSLFTFNGTWGDFFTPLIYLKQSQTTLAVQMATEYKDPSGHSIIPITLAGVILFIIPSIVTYIYGHRFIRETAPTSGLKG